MFEPQPQDKIQHPKIRIYCRRNPPNRASFWLYLGSTTQAASREEAIALYIKTMSSRHVLRAEFAETHGYYIED